MKRMILPVSGVLTIIIGALFYFGNIASLFGAGADGSLPLPVSYFAASYGAASIAWGLILLRAAKNESLRAFVCGPSALGLVLLALQRGMTYPKREVVMTFLPSVDIAPAVIGGEVLLLVVLAWGVWSARSA